jgi:glycosyltransferase involved in cell wall biosynthesis
MGLEGAPVRLRIFHPTDPLGSLPGGIETFIRGIIGWAPEDIEISVVGVTTDPVRRPVGRWLTLRCRERQFRQYAVYAVEEPQRQPRIPVVVRYLAGLVPRRRLLADYDVAEVHRLEPVLALRDDRPVTAVMHQDSEVIRQRGSDIRWRYLPGAYFALERRLVGRVESIFAVFETAVATLRERYPARADRFAFTPTWMDPDAFFPVDETERQIRRRSLRERLGLGAATPVVAFAGRFERQKHPELLIRAFAQVAPVGGEAPVLLMIGDGSLRPALERLVADLGLAGRVVFPGLLPREQLVPYLHAADAFALSSRYEGMPMSLLEAMATGLPAVSTDVGEVDRVLRDGVNGRLVAGAEPSVEHFSRALTDVLQHGAEWRGRPAIEAVAPFTPDQVLAPLYDNYRRLGRRGT